MRIGVSAKGDPWTARWIPASAEVRAAWAGEGEAAVLLREDAAWAAVAEGNLIE